MELHDYSNGVGGPGTKRSMVVTDGKRVVAKVYKTGIGPWIVRANGFDWIDPEHREPNFAGIVCTYMFSTRSVATVKKLFNELISIPRRQQES